MPGGALGVPGRGDGERGMWPLPSPSWRGLAGLRASWGLTEPPLEEWDPVMVSPISGEP